MNFRTLFFVVLAAGLWSCQPEAPKDTLPSGYEYTVHTPDNTGAAAQPEALAFFHYAMRNDEGVVNSSYANTFPQIVPVPSDSEERTLTPVEEALKIMKVGDSLTIYVPLDTIPEDQRPQGFQNADFLYYDIVLKDLKLKEDIEMELEQVTAMVNETIDQYQAGNLENLQTTDSGLKYVILEEGSGEVPAANDYVYVNYYGALLDKTMFDNSFKRGMPYPFPLKQGRVIPGWDEGIGLLKTGSKAILFIPSELGYGERGSPPRIPGNSELVFYVELISAAKPN